MAEPTKKPVIVAVDDDPDVLAAVRTDLLKRYGGDFRVVTAGGGREALALVEEMKRRAERVALLVVDQRMPDLEGTALLALVSPIYPDAKKVLLTAYADTQAAITAINEISLDHYLMKPWHPPERELYPVLDGLLDDWRANAPATFEGIRVVGRRLSPNAYAIKDWLARSQTPYRWLDLDRDSEARSLLEASDHSPDDEPFVFFPDGTVLTQPDIPDLAAKLGRRTTARLPMYDLIIVGAGPAGLGAAVYGGSEGLSCALIECRATGGQAGTSSHIDNYLGFPSGLTGADLARRATVQAERFGVELLCPAEVTCVRSDESYHYVTLDDGSELACRALLVATGMTTRQLDQPGVERFTGRGVYYGAALTEAVTYQDEPVVIVGGANSAGQAALLFARYASKVTMLVRAPSLAAGMSHYLVQAITDTPNIEVLTSTVLDEIAGTDRIEEVVVSEKGDGATRTIPASAVFVMIGTLPHTDILRGVVRLDEEGFVLTGTDLLEHGARPSGWLPARDPYLLETSVPGIFVAGDIQHGAVRRVASAVGTGAIAVTLVHRYLAEV